MIYGHQLDDAIFDELVDEMLTRIIHVHNCDNNNPYELRKHTTEPWPKFRIRGGG
jgi:hypothetical protein